MTRHLHFERFAREIWKPRRETTPQRLPPCIDACFRVPLLYTPLGDRLSLLAIKCAVIRKDIRPKFLQPIERSHVPSNVRTALPEVRPP